MFEGEPESRYFSGSPHCMPPDMSNIELVKLIREGFDFYRKAYAEQYENAPRPILKLKAGPI